MCLACSRPEAMNKSISGSVRSTHNTSTSSSSGCFITLSHKLHTDKATGALLTFFLHYSCVEFVIFNCDTLSGDNINGNKISHNSPLYSHFFVTLFVVVRRIECGMKWSIKATTTICMRSWTRRENALFFSQSRFCRVYKSWDGNFQVRTRGILFSFFIMSWCHDTHFIHLH